VDQAGEIVAERIGDWIQLYSGGYIYPLDSRPEEINRIDIAAGLSKECRFASHCLLFYTVAEHSVHCFREARRRGCDLRTQRTALMHDATEGLGLRDLPRPIKAFLPEYKIYENNMMRVLAKKYDFEFPLPEIVKVIDNGMLIDEAVQNMAPPPMAWDKWETHHRLGITLEYWTPQQAFNEFLKAADACGVLE
jgi:uncharacterized protein